MKKIYLEIGSSIGSVMLFIILIVITNTGLHAYASYGNVIVLLIFIFIVGTIGLKLAEIKD